jgi:hypothetical protein
VVAEAADIEAIVEAAEEAAVGLHQANLEDANRFKETAITVASPVT